VRIRIAGFQGAVPRIHPRLLSDSAAQVAKNTRLENGALVPLCNPGLVATLGVSNPMTIYRRPGGDWLSWPTLVDAVDGPVATERTYLTGSGAPKVWGDIGLGQQYDLALPPPVSALSASFTGTVDADTAESVTYAYTFVTVLDEESQPSPLSNSMTISTNCIVTLTGFSSPPAGRGINRYRFYRSQTDALGVADLYLVKEIATGAIGASYIHDLAVDPMQESIPSLDYDPPLGTLKGIIACANGIMAAFSGKDLYFSEPYRPHAWPAKYALTVDYPIVGLAALGTSVIVLTTGVPYIVQGTHPSAMAMQRIEQNLPCVTKRGIVDLGYAVAYPSTEGLVTISPSGGAQLVSRGLFTRKQWADLNAETFVCSQHIGRYVFSHDPEDGLGRYIGIIDLTGEQPFLITASEAPTAMFFEVGRGALYMLIGSSTIYEWDDLSQAPKSQVWRSKIYNLQTPVNFGAIMVDSDDFTAPNPANAVKVYADGVLRATITSFNAVERLPSGFLATQWEIEVIGTLTISAVTIAHTPTEIAQQ